MKIGRTLVLIIYLAAFESIAVVEGSAGAGGGGATGAAPLPSSTPLAVAALNDGEGAAGDGFITPTTTSSSTSSSSTSSASRTSSGGGAVIRRLQPIWAQSDPLTEASAAQAQQTVRAAAAAAVYPSYSRMPPPRQARAPARQQWQPAPQYYSGGGGRGGGAYASASAAAFYRGRRLLRGVGARSGAHTISSSTISSSSSSSTISSSSSSNGRMRRLLASEPCVCAFDFDNTLRVARDGREDAPALEGAAAAAECAARGFEVAIASANGDRGKIEPVLSAVDGGRFTPAFFASPLFQTGNGDKSVSLRAIASHTGARPECIALIDDGDWNEQYARGTGAAWRRVDAARGATRADAAAAAEEVAARCGCGGGGGRRRRLLHRH